MSIEKVVHLDDHRPHMTAEIICRNCGRKWQAVYFAGVLHLECPGCHQMTPSVLPDGMTLEVTKS